MKSVLSFLPLAALATAQELPVEQIPLEPDSVPSVQPLTLDAIPLIGFGTWNLKENCTEAVSWAIQTGYRHIDGAAAYGNEDKVGLGILDGLQKAGIKREDLWITSKLWNDHHEPDKVYEAIDETLHNLGLDYIDLYHMHWPVADEDGHKYIDYLNTWSAMERVLLSRKARHIGVSNFSPRQMEDLLNHTVNPPAVHQMELHPYLQQEDWVKWHEKHGIHVTGYSPLAGTNPTYDPGDPGPLLENKVITKIADERDCTPAQVALAWGISRGTSVIPKTSHLDRATENFKSLECELKEEDLEKIEELGKEYYRFSNPSKRWGVDLYEGLEDSKGNHKKRS